MSPWDETVRNVIMVISFVSGVLVFAVVALIVALAKTRAVVRRINERVASVDRGCDDRANQLMVELYSLAAALGYERNHLPPEPWRAKPQRGAKP